MAEIKVTPAVLRQKSEELQTGVKNLAQKMNELQERENSLSGMWQGAAKDSFHNAFMTSYNECQPFFQELQRFIVKLDETAKQYEMAEARATEAAQKRM